MPCPQRPSLRTQLRMLNAFKLIAYRTYCIYGLLLRSYICIVCGYHLYRIFYRDSFILCRSAYPPNEKQKQKSALGLTVI